MDIIITNLSRGAQVLPESVEGKKSRSTREEARARTDRNTSKVQHAHRLDLTVFSVGVFYFPEIQEGGAENGKSRGLQSGSGNI